jgi:glycine/D-amino acid oxidase-like deaminating enzyme/nitrite reductase/ring-hydroxylating ferredoxin subunit
MIPAQPTESIWTTEVQLPRFPVVDDLGKLDVIVIGGGITGLTTAVLLQRSGLTTAVLEQSRLGSGETGRTSAHLTEYPDAGYADIVADFGLEGARAVAQSKREALRLIEALAGEISCDFERVSGFLYSEHARDRTSLQRELEVAVEAGVAARFVERAPLPYTTAGAIEFPHQAQFHPTKYLAGLVRLYVTAGGLISEHSHVRGIDEDEGRCRVRTDRAVAHASHVVAATDAPIVGGTLLDTKLAANRSYVIALRIAASELPVGLFWDRDDPYHYIRGATTSAGPVVILGGEDHRTGSGDAASAIENLKAYARKRFPGAQAIAEWSGQIMESMDGLPFVGPREAGSHVYLATGYAGNGLTFGTVAAQVLSDLIRGAGSAHAEWYAPSRALAAREWAKYAAQNLPAAWTLVTDLLPYRRVDSVDDLEPGEGRVVRLNGQKVAASRDADGTIRLVSATCTHLGCDVAWNRLEQSWDCPCHGSRFHSDGHVLHGPATSALESRDAAAAAAAGSIDGGRAPKPQP